MGSVGWEGGEDSVVLRQRRTKVLTWFQITVGELVSLLFKWSEALTRYSAGGDECCTSGVEEAAGGAMAS